MGRVYAKACCWEIARQGWKGVGFGYEFSPMPQEQAQQALHAGRELCAGCGPRRRHVFHSVCRTAGAPRAAKCGRGCPGVRWLQTETGSVSIALQKMAAGLGKGLGQGKGLRGWIMRGDSCSVSISSWQRREGIAFPSVGTCPCRAAGSARMVHALKPPACDLAEPHRFRWVSESGVKSLLHTAHSPPSRVFCQAAARRGPGCLPSTPPAFRGSACAPSPTGPFPP